MRNRRENRLTSDGDVDSQSARGRTGAASASAALTQAQLPLGPAVPHRVHGPEVPLWQQGTLAVDQDDTGATQRRVNRSHRWRCERSERVGLHHLQVPRDCARQAGHRSTEQHRESQAKRNYSTARISAKI